MEPDFPQESRVSEERELAQEEEEELSENAGSTNIVGIHRIVG